jgi:enamine deaminase RidA (YjgF/YER057c/UK114 family)
MNLVEARVDGESVSVYETFFPEPRPARATVRADLVVGRIEIDCIALLP